MARLRVGLIGCGRISSMYRQSFRQLDAHVVGVADSELARAEAFAADFPGCAAVDSLEALLALGLDVLHICTPHHLHHNMAVRAMRAGVAVLTEKPMALSMRDARDMVAVSEQTGAPLGVIFQSRYMKAVREMKRVIDSGELGKLQGAWSTMMWSRPPAYYACSWKGKWETEGGGVLIDQAIHSIDLVQYLCGGTVEWIKGGIDNRVLTMIEVEDVADAVVAFDGGLLYSLYACNYFSRNAPIEIEIAGENGEVKLIKDVAEIRLHDRPFYRVESVREDPDGPAYWGNFHRDQIADFYDCIQTGKPIWIDGREGMKALQIVLQTYAAARSGEKLYSRDFLK